MTLYCDVISHWLGTHIKLFVKLVPDSIGIKNHAVTEINSPDPGDGIFQFWGVNNMPADALAPKVTRA